MSRRVLLLWVAGIVLAQNLAGDEPAPRKKTVQVSNLTEAREAIRAHRCRGGDAGLVLVRVKPGKHDELALTQVAFVADEDALDRKLRVLRSAGETIETERIALTEIRNDRTVRGKTARTAFDRGDWNDPLLRQRMLEAYYGIVPAPGVNEGQRMEDIGWEQLRKSGIEVRDAR